MHEGRIKSVPVFDPTGVGELSPQPEGRQGSLARLACGLPPRLAVQASQSLETALPVIPARAIQPPGVESSAGRGTLESLC